MKFLLQALTLSGIGICLARNRHWQDYSEKAMNVNENLNVT